MAFIWQRWLSQWVLVRTPHGYILGRRQPETEEDDEEAVAAAQQQPVEQLLQRRAERASEEVGDGQGWQMRQRRLPAESNFQLRVRKDIWPIFKKKS